MDRMIHGTYCLEVQKSEKDKSKKKGKKGIKINFK